MVLQAHIWHSSCSSMAERQTGPAEQGQHAPCAESAPRARTRALVASAPGRPGEQQAQGEARLQASERGHDAAAHVPTCNRARRSHKSRPARQGVPGLPPYHAQVGDADHARLPAQTPVQAVQEGLVVGSGARVAGNDEQLNARRACEEGCLSGLDVEELARCGQAEMPGSTVRGAGTLTSRHASPPAHLRLAAPAPLWEGRQPATPC